jgi:hypothetical protein
MLVAALEVSCTVTVTLLQMVVLQVPSALTKYVIVFAGATEILAPVPIEVPEHEPLYHFQLAPAPKLPPVTESVVFLPRQRLPETETLMDAAGLLLSLTSTTLTIHGVVLQVPSALTKSVSDLRLAIFKLSVLPAPT